MTKEEKSNWCQMHETVLMINVAVSRIEHAMLEGDDSFTSLSKSFIKTVNASAAITTAANQLEDSPIKDEIKKHTLDISNRISDSIVSFQFYDKLSQRMVLISKTLSALTEILKDEERPHSPDEWENLQNMIRAKYTLDADQEMFDAVIKGMPIKDALQIALDQNTKDDIEFF